MNPVLTWEADVQAPLLELYQKFLEGGNTCPESAFLASCPGDSDKYAKWSPPLVGEPHLNHILKKVIFFLCLPAPLPHSCGACSHPAPVSPCWGLLTSEIALRHLLVSTTPGAPAPRN